MTVSKSGTTCKILQYLAEPSKVLQKCFSSFRFLLHWANTVNLYAALKTESLFSLVSFFFFFLFFSFLFLFLFFCKVQKIRSKHFLKSLQEKNCILSQHQNFEMTMSFDLAEHVKKMKNFWLQNSGYSGWVWKNSILLWSHTNICYQLHHKG